MLIIWFPCLKILKRAVYLQNSQESSVWSDILMDFTLTFLMFAMLNALFAAPLHF